ncbi:secretin N-terminal domain-containing protein [Massilia solisilvae]|uniref:Secretin N-terminal domain-containing protein n=1 Tax=Massilia solisilvae TaxID=1811225 RepID=A0ABT2BMA9_9BURK|nr:secretin N-terminal domain-containing protein [Massilia solisilvae]MCS0609655.1 secretin N-terminal domain-containing protein [Massilia solisilvae]
MPIHFSKVGVIMAALALAGCQTSPRHDTYEAIKADVAKAAAAPIAPATVDAAVADALLPAPATLARELPKARPAMEERFNVTFNNVPAQRFFHAIVAGTRFNMLVHPDVSGNISANLKDVTIVEALDAVREMYGYDYKIEGNRISVRPPSMQTRMFQVNYLLGTRRGTSTLRVVSTTVANVNNNNNNNSNGLGNYNNQNNLGNNADPNNPNNPSGQYGQQQGNSTQVSTATNNDFWKELKEALQAIVGSKEDGRSIVISPQSGVVVVRAMPEELRNVDTYLKATQLSVDRQVILEAKILEVELNDQFQSGINWASFASFRSSHTNRVSTGFVGPGTTMNPLPYDGSQPAAITANGLSASSGFSLANAAENAGSLFGLAFQTSNFSALLSFLESQGTVHVLSSPRVAAMNNEKAVLKDGTDEFYVTGVSTTTNSSASGNTTSPTVTFTPFFSGVVLDVTPQIDANNNILLHVHPSVSQVTTVNKGVSLGTAGSLTLPMAASSTSEIDSMVRGQNGQVVAIGGLMRQLATDDQSQVPVAGSIPLVGNLFKSKKRVNQKRELVVLIKPTIVESGTNWSQDMLDAAGRIEKLDPNGKGRR